LLIIGEMTVAGLSFVMVPTLRPGTFQNCSCLVGWVAVEGATATQRTISSPLTSTTSAESEVIQAAELRPTEARIALLLRSWNTPAAKEESFFMVSVTLNVASSGVE